ncbi:hypothetical protein jhhlp_004975 [Lomentospora prolificans]|uniref:CENP-V/GFA domain-containing protein n=1 Tax=Lomentospora prolificans TaxID=41688 RepID=A0A2N3N814_9PEZI|nr:hypothetical protein jhhlp_004975 [Lomentospora prolificans]
MAENTSLVAEDPQETKVLTARCFCKAVQFTLTVPAALLPLRVHMCHCNVCRYMRGTPCVWHAPLPKGIEPRFVEPLNKEDMLTEYRHGAAVRLFCKTCGCHIGNVDADADIEGKKGWRVSSSIFDAHSEDNFRMWAHECTDSSPGGGMYRWVPTMAGRELAIHNPRPKEPDSDNRSRGSEPLVGGKVDERLRGECHCGGVNFSISRPSARLFEDERLKKTVSPLDKTKWQAILDLCDDCRLVSGAHAVAWVFIPVSCISPAVPADLEFGTLTVFESSKGILRAFCGVCGATVFYEHTEKNRKRSERVIDVATGILRTSDGAVGKDWFTWRTDRIAFQESGDRFDPVFSQALKEGFKAWGEKEYGKSEG